MGWHCTFDMKMLMYRQSHDGAQYGNGWMKMGGPHLYHNHTIYRTRGVGMNISRKLTLRPSLERQANPPA